MPIEAASRLILHAGSVAAIPLRRSSILKIFVRSSGIKIWRMHFC